MTFSSLSKSCESQIWVAALQRENANALLELYEVSGVEVLPTDDFIWVKGLWSASISGTPKEEHAQRLEKLVRGLYGARIYELGRDGLLFPIGKRVPTGTAPEGDWNLLVDWLEVSMPSSRLVGKSPAPSVAFSLTRVENLSPDRLNGVPSMEPSLLLCSLQHWHDFATTTADVRLHPLAFAFEPGVGVLVRGNPLPSIPGKLFSMVNNIALPVGWTWLPRLSVETLVATLGLSSDEIGVLLEDQTWHRISNLSFVKANRSSVRETVSHANRIGGNHGPQ